MPLKEEMRDNNELKHSIEDGEGLGWALEEYHYEVILDPKLRHLWKDAQEAMNEIMDYLKVNY